MSLERQAIQPGITPSQSLRNLSAIRSTMTDNQSATSDSAASQPISVPDLMNMLNQLLQTNNEKLLETLEHKMQQKLNQLKRNINESKQEQFQTPAVNSATATHTQNSNSKSSQYVPICKAQPIRFFISDSKINDVIIGKQLLIPAGISEIRDKSNPECIVYNPNENEPSALIHHNSYIFESVDPHTSRTLTFTREITIPAKTELTINKLLELEPKLNSSEIKCLQACNLIPHINSEIKLKDNAYLKDSILSLDQLQYPITATIINRSDDDFTIYKSSTINALQFTPDNSINPKSSIQHSISIINHDNRVYAET